MKLGYSEFSFGYAFTENLIRSSLAAPTGAPIFPNLVQEAKLGYDVNINLPGLPLFLQYKLPVLMTRNTAAEISKYNIPGLTTPFFRMPLMRRDLSQQHQRLIALEVKFPGTVLYASPALHNLDEFNRAYDKAGVHQRSVFFSPTSIGSLTDDKDHSVAYQLGSPVAHFCSEPREIKAIIYDDLAGDAHELFLRPQYRVLETSALELRNTVRTLVSAQMKRAEAGLSERINARRSIGLETARLPQRTEQVIENILVAREMARVDLGVDVMIAQPHQ
jgi:hypothetical protein